MQKFNKFHKKARTRKLWWQPIFLVIFGFILSIFSRINVEGKDNLPKEGFILAPNHISVLDAFFVGILLHRKVSFMGKSELFHSKWAKWMSRLGGFPVQRGTWDVEAFETASTVVRKGNVMVMFLEGGINETEQKMKPAKAGIGYLAQKTSSPVVPCWLEGTRDLYKPLSWPKVKVVFGKPVVFGEKDTSREKSQETAENIRGHILLLPKDA